MKMSMAWIFKNIGSYIIGVSIKKIHCGILSLYSFLVIWVEKGGYSVWRTLIFVFSLFFEKIWMILVELCVG